MEEFIEASFSTLPPEMLLEILKQMRPVDVALLCQTHLRMANFCSDDTIFKKLLKIHFEGYFPTYGLSNKQQYLKLIADQVTEFRIPVIKNDEECEMLDLENLERGPVTDWNQSLLVIQGDPLPGETAWIYSRLDSQGADYRSYAYPNRDECVLDAYDSYMEDQVDANQIGDVMNLSEFQVRIEDEGDCVIAYKTIDYQVVYRLDFITIP